MSLINSPLQCTIALDTLPDVGTLLRGEKGEGYA